MPRSCWRTQKSMEYECVDHFSAGFLERWEQHSRIYATEWKTSELQKIIIIHLARIFRNVLEI